MSVPASAAVAAAPPWFKRRMCAFDIESTSADPLEARIVQAAFCLVGGDLGPFKNAWIVDPGCDIPAEATAVHGLTTEFVRGEGEPTESVLPLILDLFRLAREQSWPVCIMVAPYDLTVLAMEARRCSLSLPELPNIIDPRVLDKQCDEFEGFHRRGSRKLVDLCFHYQAQLDGAHDATHDAIAAARVAYRIGQRYPQIGNLSITELQTLQAQWYREQAQGLDAYFKKQGKPGVSSFDWPVMQLPPEAAL